MSEQLEYATESEYYDTIYVTFDCKTSVDVGYGEWRLPPKKKCPNCRKWFRPIEMKMHIRDGHKGAK